MFLLATSPALPELNEDDQHLIPALKALGHDARAAVWSDPNVDWTRASAVVIRSCWDYIDHADAFAAWLSSLSETPLFNPAETMLWNMDKRYLEDLRAVGAPVPQTYWVPQEMTEGQLQEALESRDWAEFVCKPAISAGACDTWRGSLENIQESESRLKKLTSYKTMMIQPYLSEVERHGEWSFLFFDGAFSHAVLKRPAEHDFRVQDDHGGTVHTPEPPAALLEQARAICEVIPRPHLYARIDGIEVEGKLTLMEVELVEPELFLRTNAKAPEAMAQALHRRICGVV